MNKFAKEKNKDHQHLHKTKKKKKYGGNKIEEKNRKVASPKCSVEQKHHYRCENM